MGGRGSMALGAGVAAAIAVLGGCSESHRFAIDPGPSSAAREGVPGALPIGKVRPLGEELSFAFKAGYHEAEQIWLRGVDGALTRVSTWDRDPKYADTCGHVWSTIGYGLGYGRFGDMLLDPEGAHLLFTETRQCHRARGEVPSRVLAHDLASGLTRLLIETRRRPDIVVGAGTAIAIARRSQPEDTDEELPAGELELYEIAAGAIEAIEVPRGDDRLRVGAWERGHLVRWTERILLFFDRIPLLERVGGGWQRSELAAALVGSTIRAVAGSPSGSRLCAISDRIKPEGGREHGVGWVLEPNGRWTSVALADFAPLTCGFAPDESKVMFGTSFYEVRDGELRAIELEVPPHLSVHGSWRGDLYGNDGERRITRLDWSTLAVEGVLTLDDFPALCAGMPYASGLPLVHVPPDDRPLALLKTPCGCVDCDISGSLAWHSDSGHIETIEEVWGEHDVYGFAWLPNGGAVVLSTQSKNDASGREVLRPERGQYYLVSPDGAVETLGPLPGVEGVLHSPVSRGSTPR